MQYALDSVQYAENIARLLQCKVNGNLFRYIINNNTIQPVCMFSITLSHVALKKLSGHKGRHIHGGESRNLNDRVHGFSCRYSDKTSKQT